MIRASNNPLGINQHKGDRKMISLKLPESLLQEIDTAVAIRGGTRTDFIELACRAELETVVEVQNTELSDLAKEAIALSIETKQAAVRRERKQKRPNEGLISQWEEEIKELERFV